MAEQAFALKESAQDSFADAAAVVAGDAKTLRVAELLKEGKGVITTDDQAEIDALNHVEALKRISDKEAADIRKAAKTKKAGDDR